MIRKLAREATIFALIGMVVAAVGGFTLLMKDVRTRARLVGAEAVHAGTPQIHVPPGYTLDPDSPGLQKNSVEVPLTNGVVLHVRECVPDFSDALVLKKDVKRSATDYDALAKKYGGTTEENCRYFPNPYGLTPLPLGDADQVSNRKRLLGRVQKV
jgi:hypothetical protein